MVFNLLPVYRARLSVGALEIASSIRFIRSLHTSDKINDETTQISEAYRYIYREGEQRERE
jgi:hypothetical protein